jgi:hypothetical protein
MKSDVIWKSFSLCKELSLSGSYIYNGLKTFDEMETFSYTEEIFEFLYSISVGIERLQKIAIILKEDIVPERQNEFEKKLITHNHLELMKRITNTEQNDVSALSYDLLQLLSKFYKSWRYDRFTLNDCNNNDKEKFAFIQFIEKHLKVHIADDCLIATSNDVRYKKFIGRTIGKIVDYLYEIIKRESCRLQVYTYEIRGYSKAFKIFIQKEYDFINEDVFWKELLIYILHNNNNSRILELYKTFKPLEFDEGLLISMIKSLKSDLMKQEHLGMLDTLYDEIENKGERLKLLDIIGNEDIVFSEEYEDEECSTGDTGERE